MDKTSKISVRENVLTKEQKTQVKAQHELYKRGELKVISLNEFRKTIIAKCNL
jgi:hypothetical protein